MRKPRDNNRVLPQRFRGTLETASDFDFDAIEPAADDGEAAMAFALRASIDWIATGERKGGFNKRAALNRLLAMGWYLELSCFAKYSTISRLAAAFELTPEGLNKYVRALNQRFGVYSPGQKHSVGARDRKKKRTIDPSLN